MPHELHPVFQGNPEEVILDLQRKRVPRGEKRFHNNFAKKGQFGCVKLKIILCHESGQKKLTGKEERRNLRNFRDET